MCSKQKWNICNYATPIDTSIEKGVEEIPMQYFKNVFEKKNVTRTLFV
jgi:hypothetical protein